MDLFFLFFCVVVVRQHRKYNNANPLLEYSFMTVSFIAILICGYSPIPIIRLAHTTWDKTTTKKLMFFWKWCQFYFVAKKTRFIGIHLWIINKIQVLRVNKKSETFFFRGEALLRINWMHIVCSWVEAIRWVSTTVKSKRRIAVFLGIAMFKCDRRMSHGACV